MLSLVRRSRSSQPASAALTSAKPRRSGKISRRRLMAAAAAPVVTLGMAVPALAQTPIQPLPGSTTPGSSETISQPPLEALKAQLGAFVVAAPENQRTQLMQIVDFLDWTHHSASPQPAITWCEGTQCELVSPGSTENSKSIVVHSPGDANTIESISQLQSALGLLTRSAPKSVRPALWNTVRSLDRAKLVPLPAEAAALCNPLAVICQELRKVAESPEGTFSVAHPTGYAFQAALHDLKNQVANLAANAPPGERERWAKVHSLMELEPIATGTSNTSEKSRIDLTFKDALFLAVLFFVVAPCLFWGIWSYGAGN